MMVPYNDQQVYEYRPQMPNRNQMLNMAGYALGNVGGYLVKNYAKNYIKGKFKRRVKVRRPRYKNQYATERTGRTMDYGRVYGKKYKKQTRKYKKGISKNIKRYVKKVAQDKVDNQATGTWRNIYSEQISCAENSYGNTVKPFLDVTQIEDAIDQMQVINVSAGSAAATAINPTTQDGLRTRIISARCDYEFRNNSRTPCYLEVIKLFVKRRMSATETPLTIYEDGLEDRQITSNELTDLRFNIWDSPAFKRFFKVYSRKVYLVNPGDQVNCHQVRKKPFIYDPDKFDQFSASDSQPGMTQWIMFRLRGVVGHDDVTNSQVGTVDSTLDFISTQHIKFSSVMGQGFKYYVTGGGSLDTFGSGSVVNIASVDETGEVL